VSNSTVPCSRTPARTRCSTYSRLRVSSTTESIPSRWRRCESSSPAGPAPTIPTCVRICVWAVALFASGNGVSRTLGVERLHLGRVLGGDPAAFELHRRRQLLAAGQPLAREQAEALDLLDARQVPVGLVDLGLHAGDHVRVGGVEA